MKTAPSFPTLLQLKCVMFVPADGQRAGLLDIIRMGGPGRARGPGASNLDLSDFIVSVISVFLKSSSLTMKDWCRVLLVDVSCGLRCQGVL